MKNLHLTKINKHFLRFKHWIKKEWFLWGVAKTSILMDLGFGKKFETWEEFNKYMKE